MDGTLILEHAIVYVHRAGKLARTCDEHDDFSITLQLLGLIREGWTTGPGLFDLACGMSVGLPHGKYVHRREARRAFLHQQFLRLIPDYDYSREVILDGDPTDGRRKFYGNRFRNLAGEAIPRHDPRSIGEADADDTATDQRPGDWPDADGQHAAARRAFAAGLTSIRADYRGGPPKRFTSPAQRKALAEWHALRAVRNAPTYCGA